MELIATVALKPGMELGEDVTEHKGHVILKKNTILDRNYIEKPSRGWVLIFKNSASVSFPCFLIMDSGIENFPIS